MIFYVLSRFKLEAFEQDLPDFICDDLVQLIQSSQAKLCLSEQLLSTMADCHPSHKFIYKVKVEKERM